MKKALLVTLVAGLMAGTANAGILSMSFPGGATTIDALNGDIVTVEIYFSLATSSDTISTIATGFMPEPLATQLDVPPPSIAVPTGWTGAGVAGVFGSNQFAIGTTTNFVPGPTDNSPILMGTMQVQFTGNDGDTAQLMFEVPGATQLVLDSTGAGYTYDFRYPTFSGYYAFGTGSPLTSGKTGQPADPLIINGIPEPASLLLLALGGLALRRRG